jgi:hypothetical protein
VSSPEPSMGTRNWVSGRTVSPAVSSTHMDRAIDVVIGGSTDGLITLGPHGAGGCVVTVQAAVVFDDLGERLGRAG